LFFQLARLLLYLVLCKRKHIHLYTSFRVFRLATHHGRLDIFVNLEDNDFVPAVCIGSSDRAQIARVTSLPPRRVTVLATQESDRHTVFATSVQKYEACRILRYSKGQSTTTARDEDIFNRVRAFSATKTICKILSKAIVRYGLSIKIAVTLIILTKRQASDTGFLCSCNRSMFLSRPLRGTNT
jgi:hypothetical protein